MNSVNQGSRRLGPDVGMDAQPCAPSSFAVIMEQTLSELRAANELASKVETVFYGPRPESNEKSPVPHSLEGVAYELRQQSAELSKRLASVLQRLVGG